MRFLGRGPVHQLVEVLGLHLLQLLLEGDSLGRLQLLLPLARSSVDPLPQALVLTAIVISFAMTALLLVIALVARAETDSDHVDGEEPRAREERR